MQSEGIRLKTFAPQPARMQEGDALHENVKILLLRFEVALALHIWNAHQITALCRLPAAELWKKTRGQNDDTIRLMYVFMYNIQAVRVV